jgi:cob(I)alamin adenosyltransferase
MKIYTKTGDSGDTGLFGGPRARKTAPRIEAYGAVDELNAVLGLARAEMPSGAIDDVLTRVQNELFHVGAELATPDPMSHQTRVIDTRHAAVLEADIDHFEATLAPLRQFILPGGTRAAAQLHCARSVCRRAERRLVSLIDQADAPVSPALLIYLNRLSDLLFVLARAANASAGRPDVPWRKEPPPAAS